jgi:nicotinate-nucleotide adenylyltransferase
MVGLFGGSFDPIHHGHLIVARVAAEELGLAQVRFLPARAQPLKQGRHAVDAAHRAAMVGLAIDGEAGFALEPLELAREGPSFTVDTLRALREREPDLDPVLLLGMDAAAELPRWKEAGAVMRLARVAVFARAGRAVRDVPGAWRVIDVPALQISATEIRRRAAAGRSIRYWVPDAVAEYIAAHGLYRDGDG